jgi:hypothetical protein
VDEGLFEPRDPDPSFETISIALLRLEESYMNRQAQQGEKELTSLIMELKGPLFLSFYMSFTTQGQGRP